MLADPRAHPVTPRTCQSNDMRAACETLRGSHRRNSADCKGDIVMHLTARRAVGPGQPLGITGGGEGNQENGTRGGGRVGGR
ncbi:hypothetical protein, partial [Nocardia brasiliensis]|uniref:hypothetical protein n=1 Tax=Nocardia brasiliensis TaxID=37326 RepID=UPI002455282F